MTTFALVHGAWCGAWSWEALTPLLRRAGHDVVAVDLPCDDPSADFEDYAAEVCRALAGRDDQVVIVGHSLGANTIPLVAARRPLQHLVYVAGVMPDIGRSIAEQLSTEDNMMMPVGIRHWANQIHSSERHGSTLTAHAPCSTPTLTTSRPRRRSACCVRRRLPHGHAVPADRIPFRQLHLCSVLRRSGGQPKVVTPGRTEQARR